jgi:preprotein translocase subunit SecE
VARDRKRAKQRRERRAPRGAPAAARPEDRSESGLQRADVPGALEHASGEVEEFDAALVRGAGGVPLPPDAPPRDAGAGGVALENVDEGAGNGAVAEKEEVERVVERRERRRPLPARAVAFLRASWAELQRVQWPDRPQVSQATAVVLGFVAVAGVYLGVADWVAQKIINFIL